MDWDFTDKSTKKPILDEHKDSDKLYFECYKCGMFGIDHQSTIIHRSVPLFEGKLYKGMIVLCNDCKPKEY